MFLLLLQGSLDATEVHEGYWEKQTNTIFAMVTLASA